MLFDLAPNIHIYVLNYEITFTVHLLYKYLLWKYELLWMSSEEPWLLLAFLFPSQFTDDTGVRKKSCMSNGLFSIHGIEKKL